MEFLLFAERDERGAMIAGSIMPSLG